MMGRVDKLTIQQGGMLCIISFIISRFVYLGRLRLYFDESPLNYFVQYVDPQLLKTDLWKSLYYLYDQPPGFNLLLGIVLKAFPNNHGLAFQLFFIGLGVLFALSLLALMVKLCVPTWISTGLVIIFSCSPAVVLYENWLFYTYPTAALLCLAAVFLHRFASNPDVWDGLAFFLSSLWSPTSGDFFTFTGLFSSAYCFFTSFHNTEKKSSWPSVCRSLPSLPFMSKTTSFLVR